MLCQLNGTSRWIPIEVSEQPSVPLIEEKEIMVTLQSLANSIDANAVQMLWDDPDTVRIKLRRLKQLYGIKQETLISLSGIASSTPVLSTFLNDKAELAG
jgi:hypothetical protein